jgi:BMFP domain-containing protein YqiC
MDVVSQHEFEIQREMLNALRSQIEALTAKVDALEREKVSAK